MKLNQLLHALHNPNLSVIDLSLTRVKNYLQAVGNPHLSLPPVIHVAGTNGKGSTIAYLRAALQAQGLRVHQFTSPHLVHFRERIMVANHDITDEQLIPLLQQVYDNRDALPLTFFEANTVAAFMAFAQTPADVVLLEVGMGGRFDATNVVLGPALTIITPVSMDHAEFLGDTVAKIAFEKAGIIKSGVPVIVAAQQPDALAVIEKVAHERGAPLWRCGVEWHYRHEDHDLHYQSSTLSIKTPAPALAGEHQWGNAATALAALEVLNQAGWNIGQLAMQRGVAQATWPARLQKLSQGTAINPLPKALCVWLDGGHNESAAHALAQWMITREHPIHLVVGMTKAKDAVAFLSPIVGHAVSVCVVPIEDEPMAMPMEVLREAAIKTNGYCDVAVSYRQALQAISERHDGAQADILICGSLYLAGQVLAENS